MRRCSVLIVSVALSLGLASCVLDEEDASDEMGDVDEAAEIGSASQELSRDQPASSGGEVAAAAGHARLAPAGQVCGGLCRESVNWAYSTCRWNVTQNCRERIVEFCHNRNWSFIDAYWRSTCHEGWIRLWPAVTADQ